jgi:Ca-activated chloride channel homolog
VKHALAAVVVVVALTVAAPAAAQTVTPTPSPSGSSSARAPVVGGGSFNTAPLIGPGSYRDTLLPGERLFYGVKLGAGQRLQVSGQLRGRQNVIEDAATGFSVGIQTPLREVDVLDLVDEDIAGNGTVTTGSPGDKIEFVSVPALTGSAARDEGITYRGPGTWYVSLYLISDEQHPPRVEIPVDLGIKVIGSPQPDPDPEKTPARPASAASAGGDEGGGTSIGAVLGVGIAALAIGAALGATAAVVTRRRRGA